MVTRGVKRVVTVGMRFGGLQILEVPDRYNVNTRVRCACDCGAETTAAICSLFRGRTVSCGCRKIRHILENKPSKKHGLSHTGAYNSWALMHKRCSAVIGKHSKSYGDVSCCERWAEFENFYADMGDRPKGMTLDRINPFGNYEPANCRWATSSEQNNNKRANHPELDPRRLVGFP